MKTRRHRDTETFSASPRHRVSPSSSLSFSHSPLLPVPLSLLLLILLAFTLYVYRLDGQSLWADEGWSLEYARKEPASLLQGVWSEATMPPLYYLLLWGWIRWAGETEFALRFLSLLFAVLLVPLLYRLGRRLRGDDLLGLSAAFLVALSPLYVHYAQETRMYSAMTFFSATSVCVFLAALDRATPSRKLWALYAITVALSLYTFYLTLLVIIAQAIFLALFFWRYRSHGVPWIAAQLIALALFLPWFLYAYPQMRSLGGAVTRFGIPLSTIVEHVLVAFSFGPAATRPARFLAAAPLLAIVLAILSLLSLTRAPRGRSLFLLIYFAAPVLLLYAISFTPMPDWVRYFMATSPAYYLLIADGVVAGARLLNREHTRWLAWGWLGIWGVALLFLAGSFLNAYYFEPGYARDDHRTNIRALEARAAPDGALIVNDLPATLFHYYFRQRVPYYVLPQHMVAGKEYTPQELLDLAAQLQTIADRHPRLGLIKVMPSNFDMGNHIQVWLARYTFPVEERWVGNYLYNFYLSPPQPLNITPLEARFGNVVRLVHYGLSARQLRPGDELALLLHWSSLQKVQEDRQIKVFVQLLDAENKVRAQRDAEPVSGFHPMRLWTVSEEVDDRYGLVLPETLPPGNYRLIIGVYDVATGARWPVSDAQGRTLGDFLLLAEIRVRP